MIFINEHHRILEGTGVTLLAETTIFLKELREVLTKKAELPVEDADKLIEDCLTHSRRDKKQVEAAIMDSIKDLMKMMEEEQDDD